MNRFENHVSNKRNSRLDSFLQKNLGHYGYVRYYEPCVIESKGNFLHCHLILTDEYLLVTQNPPKTLTLSIQLSDIHDIRLVPERHSVVIGSGPNVFTSQHVHVLSHKKPRSLTFTSPNIDSSNSSPTSQLPNAESPTSNVTTKFCRKGTFDLPLSLKLTYLPNQATKAIVQSTADHHTEKGLEMPVLINGRNSGEESDSSESFKSLDISSNGETVTGIPHRASSVLEQNLTSWRVTVPATDNGSISEKRRPSSADLGARPLTSRTRFLGKYLRAPGKRKTESKQVIFIPVQSHPIPEYDEAHFHLYQSNSVFLNEIFLYWNRQILKRTCQLDKILSTDKKGNPRIKVLAIMQDGGETQNHFIDSVQNMTEIMRLEVLQIRHMRAHFYTLLCNFHEVLRKDFPLQRVCFQNSRFATSLLSILENTIESTDSLTESSKDSSWSRALTEMLSIQLVLLDIFRILIQTNTGTGAWSTGKDSIISFGRKGNTNWNIILKTLIHLTAVDEGSFGKDIQSITSDPHTFFKGRWRSSPQAQVISLVAMKFTISVSLLYEITSLFLYTPGDHSIPALLSKIQTAPFLRQIVTQIFSIILPVESRMTSSQAVTLYHQILLLRILMNNSSTSFPTDFLSQTFYEEFKYFVNGKSLAERIPDEFPIKARMISVFNAIRTEILKSPKCSASNISDNHT